MIKSFKCKETEKIFNGKFSKKLPSDIQNRALIKLHMIDRAGQHSIRINQQFRICFAWSDNNAYNVEIVDYH